MNKENLYVTHVMFEFLALLFLGIYIISVHPLKDVLHYNRLWILALFTDNADPVEKHCSQWKSKEKHTPQLPLFPKSKVVPNRN